MTGMAPSPLSRFTVLTVASAAAAACWLAAAAPAVAQADGCPAFERPQVSVSLTNAPLRRDFTRTIQQLARIPGRAPGPAGSGSGHILGLAHAVFQQTYDIAVSYGQLGDGAYCGALASVSVTFGTQERVVYVARELPRGSCIHREVLDHEMQHVAVDDALMEEYLAIIRRRVAAVAAQTGTVRSRSRQQVMTTLRRPIDAEMRTILDEFTRERDRRQAGVDTVDEYERVSRSCGGELGKYVTGQGRM
ncbi:hypothetical protein [Azospirillum halopraeferens]|uniref:hypothetical protein n=1 Tax=Azospirillum halopraeferens TaxID=34010 RepID=UPI0003F76228|nr:hypothetical protein [Azospirillum halopraeferens]